MMTDALARRYARAVFEAAEKQDASEQVREDLRNLAQLLDTSRRFRYFLLTPRINKARKPAMLKEMLGGFSSLSLSFVELLIEKRRQELIPRIAEIFGEMSDAKAGLVDVHVNAAQPLEPSDVSNIVRQLEDRLQQRVRLRTAQDASLLGGLVIQIGHTVYDYSARGQLELMRRRLL